MPQNGSPGGNDKQLGRWVVSQRMAYKAYKTGKKGKYGMLTAEKALKLAQVGFAFDAKHIHKTPKNINATEEVAYGGMNDVQNEEVESHGNDESQQHEWASYEQQEAGVGNFV